MKCDELKYEKLGDMMPFYPRSTLVIRKQYVDEAIAELKEKLAEEREFGKNRARDADHEIGKLCVEIKNLQAENERLKSERDGALGLTTAGITLEDLTAIAKKHLNETKRALWIARAERAIEKIAWFKLWNAGISTMDPEDGARHEYDKWKKALGKFLKKAEEYK